MSVGGGMIYACAMIPPLFVQSTAKAPKRSGPHTHTHTHTHPFLQYPSNTTLFGAQPQRPKTQSPAKTRCVWTGGGKGC